MVKLGEGIQTVCVKDGYQPLLEILVEALDQAQSGKGRIRHANNKPFLEQPIMAETHNLGLGFPLGQARKKLLESFGSVNNGDPDRAIADMLGAINYTAAAILAIRKAVETQGAIVNETAQTP